MSPGVLDSLDCTVTSTTTMQRGHVPLLLLSPYDVCYMRRTSGGDVSKMDTLPLNIAIYRLCTRKVSLSWSTIDIPFGLHDSVYNSAIPYQHTLAGTFAVPGACGKAVAVVYTIWDTLPVLVIYYSSKHCAKKT